MNIIDRKQCLDSIKEIAGSIEYGTSISIICPFCEYDFEVQGRPKFIWTPNSSMSITRTNEGVLYNCFRATCKNGHGLIPTIPSYSRDVSTKEFKPRIFNKPLKDLPDIVYKYLERKYGLSKEELDNNGARYSPIDRRLFLPVFNSAGFSFGAITRALIRGDGVVKTLTYFDADTTGLHYPRTRCCISAHKKVPSIAIVEDILSSIKVGRYIPCVALLGTHLNDRQINELQMFTERLMIMLDPDALAKAHGLRSKYSLFFKDITVIPLIKDPKDSSDETLRNILCN